MRRSRVWLLLILIAVALVIVFLPAAVRRALAPGYAEVDLKSLGNFPFDPNYGVDAGIPTRWRKLDGKRVALEGFMFDPQSTGSATQRFQLVYQIRNQFGGPPRVQERVFATVPHGTVRFFSDNEVEVEGTLHVGVANPTGDLITSVFRLDVDRVNPTPNTEPRP